ncbi:MAG: plasmid recombination protein [Oscillospiraceae bacterium]|nr:plasmid recombination protein [Oscillospiraceae bacterium]
MGSISMPQGKGSQYHNRRGYNHSNWPKNIDRSRTPDNITFIDVDVRTAYKSIFGRAVDEYNARQKRADRKIDSYYDYIKKSKNKEKLFYEDVIQWGCKEDFENNPHNRERAKKALVKYANSFHERNHNLKIIGAYLHMDEASPHLHIDYIPVASGYKQGLKLRNSLDRAMREMGFCTTSKKANATQQWKDNERSIFADICRSCGLQVDREQQSTRQSLSVEEYGKARDKMKAEIAEEKAEELQQIEENLKAAKEAKEKWEDLYYSDREKDCFYQSLVKTVRQVNFMLANNYIGWNISDNARLMLSNLRDEVYTAYGNDRSMLHDFNKPLNTHEEDELCQQSDYGNGIYNGR